tara:strand:- start:2617 stop:3342 length:726 start_codon:yes stop_codon:yes gene_type:complete
MKYKLNQHGFEIINLESKFNITLLKKKIINIYSTASKMNGLGIIKTDYEIEKLYKMNKKIWISAYDQARMLPDIFNVINKKNIKLISKTSKIKFPSLTSKPVIRVCMPNNIGTSRTNLHIDYPTHRGSANSITVWVPLQDTNLINGTLKIVPFSHKEKNYYGSIKKSSVIRKEKIDDKNLASISVKLGQAIVLSQFTAHTSGDNLSKKIRYSLDFRLNDLSDKLYAKRAYYINEKSYFKKF